MSDSSDQKHDTGPGMTDPGEGLRPQGIGPERLWAPWRIAYFTEPQPGECIFCTLPLEQEDRQTLILARFEGCYVIMNRYPYSNGHVMVVPYEHLGHVCSMEAGLRSEVLEVAGTCTRVLEEALSAQGFNLGFNLGRAAGAGILDHVHLHVVPRWVGDTNFMPVLSDTKVLSEGLEDTYDRLLPVFKKHIT